MSKIFILILLCATTVTVSGQTFVSQSGDTYFYDGSSSLWCVTDSTDTLTIDTTRVAIQVPEDSTLTEDKLDAAGFTSSDIVSAKLPGSYYYLSVPHFSNLESFMDSLESWSEMVEWAQYDIVAHYYADDTYFDEQWGLSYDVTSTEDAWDLPLENDPVKVYVIDSGIPSPAHPDLPPVIGVIHDPNSHGTGVLGILCAKRNSIGVAGVVQLNSVYVYSLGTTITVGKIAQGIDAARLGGAKVVNISAGATIITFDEYVVLKASVEAATDDDILIVAASGQPPSKGPRIALPASYPKVLAVAAVEEDGDQFGFYYNPGSSEQSPGVDVVAPGGVNAYPGGGHGRIYTTDLVGTEGEHVADSPVGDYRCSDATESTCFGGTSAAAPFVSGVAAIVRQQDPSLTWEETRDIIRHSARKVPQMEGAYYHEQWGFGVVNTYGALVGALYDAQLVEGVISSSITLPYPNSPFSQLFLSADLKVASGCTVTVSSGTEVYILDGDKNNLGTDTTQVELIVEGTLRIAGDEANPVTFRMWPGAGGGLWEGLHVDGGTVQMEFCNLGATETGILVSNPTGTNYIRNSTVEIESGTAIDITGGDIEVSACEVKVTNGTSTNIGVMLGGVPTGDGHVVTDCFVSVPSATGMKVDLSGNLDKHEISFCTIDDVEFGIDDLSGQGTITNCIVWNVASGGKGIRITGSSYPATYCISESYGAGDQAASSSTNDPLYCDGASGDFTLRVDSYGNKSNNGSGERIGAFPVECMYGTLARSSTFGSGTLDVLGDTTIPLDSTLTLNAGAVLVVDDDDNQEAGGDVNEVQINVKGTLTANGQSGNEVVFRSVTGAAGSWDGILIPYSGTADPVIDLEYATIEDGEYGILSEDVWDQILLSHVTIDNFESAGLYLFPGVSADHDLSVDHAIVAMNAAPLGVYLRAYLNADVAYLTVGGSSEGLYGLYLDAVPGPTGSDPAIESTSISGLSQGTGIYVDRFSPQLLGAFVDSCKWGIQLRGSGTPKLQADPNTYPTPPSEIDHCETGLYVYGDLGPDVDDLLILRCTKGLYTDSTSVGSYTEVTIDADSLLGSVGFKSWSTAAHTFRSGTIVNFDEEGVTVSAAGLLDLGTTSSHGNNAIYSDFTPTAYVKCKNRVAELGDIKAEKNYWGAGQPPANMFSVSIDYTPWLTVPPASAPNVEMVVLPEKIFAVSPNPMTGETAVLFTIPNGAEDVSLHVFDVNGRLVRNLLPTAPPAGLQQVVWDGRDGSGRQAPPGVYFVRYRDQEANKAKKIVRLP